MDDLLRFVPDEDTAEWVRRETRRRLKDSTIAYLNHLPARPLAAPAAINKELILPKAETIGPLPTVGPPTLVDTGDVTIGVEPLTEEWDKNSRYRIPIRYHGALSMLGFVASYTHEWHHVTDTISFGGLPWLLGEEARITSYKPIRFDPADLWKQVQQAVERLTSWSLVEDPWKRLATQLEVEPTFSHVASLTNKDSCMKRIYGLTSQALCEAASEATRPEFFEFFAEAVSRPEYQTHRLAIDLLVEIKKVGLGSCAPFFVGMATELGFVGRECLLKLAKENGKIYAMYWQQGPVERVFNVLFETLDLSGAEYRRILLGDLDRAASATGGWTEKRLRALRSEADRVMKLDPNGTCFGLLAAFLLELGRVPYIFRVDLGTDSDVEALLSFYVDSDISRKTEEPIKRYLKACAVGEEKPVHDMLVCPLFNAIQPPWCPGCSGKLKYALEKGAIRYEPGEGLNQNCPIIKEWIGEKNLRDLS